MKLTNCGYVRIVDFEVCRDCCDSDDEDYWQSIANEGWMSPSDLDTRPGLSGNQIIENQPFYTVVYPNS